MRKLVPLTLVTSLAMFGCTLMNRTPGNGQPFSATPSMSPATTPGSSSGNVPMASSYTTPTSTTRLAADQAAAIMREHQAYNGRFLGYLNPTPVVQQQGPQLATGELVEPSLNTDPQVTVNSSISSPPTPVVPTVPATVRPRTPAASGFRTLTPALTVIPASTSNAAPITVSNSDGQIVVSNVKSN